MVQEEEALAVDLAAAEAQEAEALAADSAAEATDHTTIITITFHSLVSIVPFSDTADLIMDTADALAV